jgi:hypothetical protein
MTQALLILILSADNVSGGQGAKGGQSQLCVWLFPFSGGERVEIGASGCVVAKRRKPLSTLGFAGTP